VSQDGFEFGPPPPRREPRRFEPPPWERDQFERRSREQEERERTRLEAAAEAREAEAAAQQAEAAGAIEETAERAEAGPTEGPAREVRPRAHVNDPTTARAGAQQGETPAPAKEPVDEKQVALMMLELKAGEPAALEGAWKAAIAAGIVVVLVGIVIGIWGATAIVRLGQAGVLGGMVLVGFGLSFAGIGGWLVFRSLRQRGVL